VAHCEARPRLDKARVPFRDRDGKSRADRGALAGGQLDPLARRQIEAGVARVRTHGHDGVFAKATERELDHRRFVDAGAIFASATR
jgi:hypothetical protein